MSLKTALNGPPRASEDVKGFEGGWGEGGWQTLLTALNGRSVLLPSSSRGVRGPDIRECVLSFRLPLPLPLPFPLPFPLPLGGSNWVEEVDVVIRERETKRV